MRDYYDMNMAYLQENNRYVYGKSYSRKHPNMAVDVLWPLAIIKTTHIHSLNKTGNYTNNLAPNYGSLRVSVTVSFTVEINPDRKQRLGKIYLRRR